jgi:hypothetical protein
VIVLLIYKINAYMTLDNARRKSNAMIKRKRTNNDITQQTKEQVTGTLHNTKVELW